MCSVRTHTHTVHTHSTAQPPANTHSVLLMTNDVCTLRWKRESHDRRVKMEQRKNEPHAEIYILSKLCSFVNLNSRIAMYIISYEEKE